jgi:hypothetical protein
MNVVVLDLDDPGAVERVWTELQRYRAIWDADPELRRAILRRVDGMAGTLDPMVRDEILSELDHVHPAVVLEALFHTLVPNTETIGAVRRRRYGKKRTP